MAERVMETKKIVHEVGGGSSSSKFSFSLSSELVLDDGNVDARMDGGSSSSKVAFSFDGSGGDGRVLRRGSSSS